MFAVTVAVPPYGIALATITIVSITGCARAHQSLCKRNLFTQEVSPVLQGNSSLKWGDESLVTCCAQADGCATQPSEADASADVLMPVSIYI